MSYDTGYSKCLALYELTTVPNGTEPTQPPAAALPDNLAFVFGVAVALGASAMQALGMNMQRLTFLKEQAKPLNDQRPVWKSWIWIIGLILYIVSQLAGQPVALGTPGRAISVPAVFISPAILAPLGSATLVFNAIFAKVMVKEPFTRIHFAGTVIIIGGAVIIALFGFVPESSYDLDQLVVLFASPAMIGVICGCSVLIVVFFSIGMYLVWCDNHYDRRPRYLKNVSPERIHALPGIFYAAMAGVMGSATLLLGKVGVELLYTSIFLGDNQFVFVGSWIILIVILVLGAAQIVYLNKGFAIAPATIIVPIFFCFFSIFSMIQTICYFEQWTCFTGLQGGMVALGAVTILVGVALLSRPAAVVIDPSSSNLLLADDNPDDAFVTQYSRMDDGSDSNSHRRASSTDSQGELSRPTGTKAMSSQNAAAARMANTIRTPPGGEREMDSVVAPSTAARASAAMAIAASYGSSFEHPSDGDAGSYVAAVPSVVSFTNDNAPATPAAWTTDALVRHGDN